jgi:4-hydroxybenzoate polyprenyltransferase
MIWLRLIRWNNLLIILLTQLLAWICVIVPLHPYSWLVTAPAVPESMITSPLLLTPVNFALLCLSTVLIAAAGYIINDYFDIRIDAINKPDKVILERQIPRKQAIIVHSVMNAVALIMAGIVAWQAHRPELLIIQVSCTLLLWKYSTSWKRQFMTGNVLVATMTALTIVILMLYEPRLTAYLASGPFTKDITAHAGINPAWMLYFLCFFAFMLTWMREIVKDMEDYKGDAEEGCITMPIKWGIEKSILFTRILGVISLAAILPGIYLYAIGGWLMIAYLGILFGAITAWLFFIGRRFTTPHFHEASRYLKIIMVMGICSLLVYRFQYA